MEIFINEDIDIPEDQAKLWKEVQKVREVRNEGKWALIINRKDVIWDRNQKYNSNNSTCFRSPLGIVEDSLDKGPKLSWILTEINIIILVET